MCSCGVYVAFNNSNIFMQVYIFCIFSSHKNLIYIWNGQEVAY
jgi:hypothetical protein